MANSHRELDYPTYLADMPQHSALRTSFQPSILTTCILPALLSPSIEVGSTMGLSSNQPQHQHYNIQMLKVLSQPSLIIVFRFHPVFLYTYFYYHQTQLCELMTNRVSYTFFIQRPTKILKYETLFYHDDLRQSSTLN